MLLPSLLLSSHDRLPSVFLFRTLKRTLVIGFRAHQDNPGWSLLEFLDSITSAKILFPYKVESTGAGG